MERLIAGAPGAKMISATADVFAPFREYLRSLTLWDAVYPPGLILFGTWLVRTSWGRKALASSYSRRNNMPLYLPFVLLLGFFGVMPLMMSGVQRVSANLADWQAAALGNLTYSIVAAATVAVSIFLAREHFARRLKGFGLDGRTILRDIPAAFVNLLAVWPLFTVLIVVTIYVSRLFWREYQMQPHEQLQLVSEHPQVLLQISVVVVAVVMAPLVEEVLFRGMFQTAMRVFLGAYWVAETTGFQRSLVAWVAIAITSGLFAVVHADAGHWPVLFVLSLCLGYAYEKSGSLVRPIVIHAMFNGIMVLSTMSQ